MISARLFPDDLLESRGPREIIKRTGYWRDDRMVDRYTKLADGTQRETAAQLARIGSRVTRCATAADSSRERVVGVR